tara:strand:+ start:5090 stop:5572 length:483 start_codon:yes stop_codon:yes gene_type:complete
MKVNETKRYNIIENSTLDLWKSININPEIKIVRKIAGSFARDNIFKMHSVNKSKILKYFAKDSTRWMIMIHVIYFSAKGDQFYKNKKIGNLGISLRKQEQVLNDCLNAGYFIYAEESNQKSTDKKIKNIRPSEKLVAAWMMWNIDNLKRTIKNIKRFNFK